MEPSTPKLLIVGEPECRFNDIVQEILDSPVKSQLTSQYKKFARLLDYPEDKLAELSQRYYLGISTSDDILMEILSRWRMTNAKNATLHRLVSIIRKDFNEFACLLETRFMGIDHLKSNTVKIKQPTSSSNTSFLSPLQRQANPVKTVNHPQFKAGHLNTSSVKTENVVCNANDNSHISSENDAEPCVNDPFLGSCNSLEKTNGVGKKSKTFRTNITILAVYTLGILVIFSIFATLLFVQSNSFHGSKRINSNHLITESVENVSVSTSNQIYSRIFLSTMTELDVEELNITVTSYKDYNQTLQTVSRPSKIRLSIILSNVNEWPPDGHILYPECISHLYVSGPLHWRVVFDFLVSSSVIHTLILNDNNKGLCDLAIDFQQNAVSQTVFLSKLEYFRLEKLSSCANLYLSIVFMFKMNNLRTFELIESVIDENNVDSLARILRQTENLTKLEISVTSSIEKPVTYFLAEESLQNLKHLKYELNGSNINERTFTIGKEIRNSPCKLESFISRNGIVSYSDIFYCKYLRKLDIAIYLSEPTALFDVSIFSKKLPFLKDLRIVLYFARCPAKALLGWGKLEECIPNFYICSDCVIMYPQSIVVSSSPTRHEDFSRKSYC